MKKLVFSAMVMFALFATSNVMMAQDAKKEGEKKEQTSCCKKDKKSCDKSKKESCPKEKEKK